MKDQNVESQSGVGAPAHDEVAKLVVKFTRPVGFTVHIVRAQDPVQRVASLSTRSGTRLVQLL